MRRQRLLTMMRFSQCVHRREDAKRQFNRDLQLDEMFCQSEAYAGQCSESDHSVIQLRQSSSHEKILQKQKSFDLHAKLPYVHGYPEQKITQEDEDDSAEKDEDNNNTMHFLRWQRHQLERDVLGLQGKLQQEVDLHYALENAFRPEAGGLSGLCDLPAHAKKLVSEVAMLEVAISSLEEQIASLNFQLGYERRHRQLAEGTLRKPPLQGQEFQTSEPHCYQSFSKPPLYCVSSNALPNVEPPGLVNIAFSCKNTYIHEPLGNFRSPVKQESIQDFSSGVATGPDSDSLVQNAKLGYKHFWKQSGFFSLEKLKPESSASSCGEMSNAIVQPVDVKHTCHNPNKLSEKMVECMISIYRHLSDSIDGLLSSKSVASPTSPHGNTAFSSVSSISESSSTTRSPPIDSRSKEFGSDKTFDPYKLPDKIAWSDIGAYSSCVQVSEMSVGKEQLDYAAEALRMFRSLVEQLSRANPGRMKHNEKLSFWINVYNALMMHAYLAYGVPKNDFKFFSLMQKAAYTVGGHSFNAVVIEHLLLKAKAQWYRPQFALLLAHQKLKLREEVSTFAIDRVEPLVAFSLSFGATSSPAVQVYTAENIHSELQFALRDYARASVGVSTRGKLLIPNLLCDFGLDSMEEGNILDWICQFLPREQSSLIRNCMNHRQHKSLSSKHLSVVPFDFHFRYLFLLPHTHRTECR